MNWNMNLGLSKLSSSTHCSLQNCFQLWGKWHYHNATQSICSNFFSSGPTNCILGCILIHFWWKEERFSSCPSFASLFREVEEVVLIRFAWGGHWMERSASAAKLFCVNAKSITADCISELHFMLGSDATWMLQYAPSGTQAEFRQCFAYLVIKMELVWEWGAWLPRNSKHKGMLGQLCSSKNRC